MDRYEQLKAEAEGRFQERLAGKIRVVVQDAQCARAVGSLQVVDAARDAVAGLASRGELAVAGCDGACYLAPRVEVSRPGGAPVRLTNATPDAVRRAIEGVATADSDRPDDAAFRGGQVRRVLDGCGEIDAGSLDAYLRSGGYRGLARALEGSPETVIDEVLDADLRGRGGAYFPAARKWQGARAVPGEPRYVVVNAEEGEPGVYKDRHLMEGMPHRLLEGMLIAGYAADAARGFIYVNAEAGLSAERMRQAIDQAARQGILGPSVLGSGFGFEVELRRGAGGYVCGEETTLLNTIEGRRREPRIRPPFPTEAGLWGRPTVINNVETLANVAWIMANGSGPFRETGEGAAGTKLVSLSGAILRPGLVEVAMGVSLREIVYGIGGGPRPGRRIVAVVAGGPSGGLLPEEMLDLRIGPGPLHESGAVLGSGGLVVVDDSVALPQVVRKLAAYNAAESCGKCTPCREGTPRMVEALDRLIEGSGGRDELAELRELCEVVASASLCGLGQMAGGPIVSALHFFGDAFERLPDAR